LPIFSRKSGGGSGGSSSGSSRGESLKSSNNEQVTHRQTIRRVSGRDAFTTPSIREALNNDPVFKDQAPSSATVKNPAQSINVTQPLTQEKLTEVWKTFVEKIEAPQLKSALSSREPKLKGHGHIEYELDNELQLQRLTLDLKPKLLGNLRQEFSNDSIDIDFSISTITDETSSVPYTESEKWQSLVEKYPALAALKTKFGLDFEQ
jgi:hypothetical protein